MCTLMKRIPKAQANLDHQEITSIISCLESLFNIQGLQTVCICQVYSLSLLSGIDTFNEDRNETATLMKCLYYNSKDNEATILVVF